MNITGKANNKIRENHHPIKNAKKRPEIAIENANKIVPIFSPKALWMDYVSFVSLDDNSVTYYYKLKKYCITLKVSNQPISYCKIDLRYATLV